MTHLTTADLAARLDPPGIVINALKGDPEEKRAHALLEWHGSWDLDAAFIGVPFDGASTVRTGSRHGPDAVRQALSYYTSYSTFARAGFDALRLADVGDAHVVLTDMRHTFARLTELSRGIFEHGIKPVWIGGDHSISWPILEGLTQAHRGRLFGIVHFDAHHDLREAHFGAESSGVPFRKVLNFEQRPFPGRNMVQIGINEFANTPNHLAYAEEMGVTVIPSLAVQLNGMERAVDTALERASSGTSGIYISVDIDSIDQSQAPGTAAPNPNGLDARDVYRAVRRLAATGNVVGMDITEISPNLEPNNLTGNVGAMLVLNFFMGLAQVRTKARG